MRVVHCIPSMEPGGAERQLCYLCSELVARGVEVHVVLLRGGALLSRLERSGAQIHLLSGGSQHRDPRLWWRMFRLLYRLRPDVIHSWFRFMDLTAGGAALAMRVPWVVAERSSPARYRAVLAERLRRILARRCDLVVANSRQGAAYWSARVARERLVVIPNGIPLDEVRSSGPAFHPLLDRRNGEHLLLFAGRFEPGKNIELLIEVVAKLRAELPLRLLLCGDGPLRPHIAERVRALGLEPQIQLLGYVPDIWSWMLRVDLLLFASEFEGCPNTVLDAMACGLPMVVSDIPAHRELLDRAPVPLCRPLTVDAFCEGVRTLLDERSTREAITRYLLDRAQQLSTGAMGAAYESLYRRLLSPRRERCAA